MAEDAQREERCEAGSESGGERDDWMTRQLATEFAVGSNLPLTWGACHCISSRVCGLLGARRLGHLAVLRARARPDGARSEHGEVA